MIDMDATCLEELSTTEYWDQRYVRSNEKSTVSHEWFRSFAAIQDFLLPHLPVAKDDPHVLHLGCGDSVSRVSDLDGIERLDTPCRTLRSWI